MMRYMINDMIWLILYIMWLYYIIESPSYMRSVVDRNVVMRHVPVFNIKTTSSRKSVPFPISVFRRRSFEKTPKLSAPPPTQRGSTVVVRAWINTALTSWPFTTFRNALSHLPINKHHFSLMHWRIGRPHLPVHSNHPILINRIYIITIPILTFLKSLLCFSPYIFNYYKLYYL